MFVDHLLKTKKEFKNLKKQEIESIFTEMNYSGFQENIWGADLGDMQLKSKFNKGFRFLWIWILLVNMFGLFL